VFTEADTRYAWRLAAALTFVLTLGSGFVFYNLSVYLNVLSIQHGFSVASMSGAITVMFLVGAPVGIVVGRLIQRHDLRIIMTFGAVLGGLALVALGRVQSLWQVYLAYVAMGVGYTCVSLLPVTTLITRWFDDKRRPVAMSVTTTGLSLGGVVFTPLTVLAIAAWSFESAMLVIGVVFSLCILPVIWLSVRPWPAGTAHPGRTDPGDDAAYRGIARSRFFIGVTITYLVNMAAQVGGITHLFNRSAELVERLDASLAVSILGMASIAGRLAGGWLVSRLPMRSFMFGNLIGQTAGLLVIALADSRGALWFGAGLFGVSIGNLLMLHPLLLAQVYSVRYFPRLYALSQSFTTLGLASGPLLLGWVRDASGYGLAFLIAAAGSMLAMLVLLGSGPAPRDDQASDDH
jgi:MFS family permease